MYYTRQGTIPRKPFTLLLQPDGHMTHEELFTSGGFRGPSSLIYRLRPATALVDVRDVRDQPIEELPGSDVRNHQIDTARILAGGTFATARLPLFFNDDLVYSVSRPETVDGTFYRNALADELVLIVCGNGRLGSTFGSLEFGPLDLLYMPRGVTVAFEELSPDAVMIVMETASPIAPPAQYLGVRGQLSLRGMYTERDIRLPALQAPRDVEDDHSVIVRAGRRMYTHIVPSHPFDAVGWDGTLYPFALNMQSLTPVSGRVHTTPDVYYIFEAEGVCISAIAPVRQPDHPESTSAQPDHISDYDEIFHRLGRPQQGGFEPGVVTLHTRAAPHGPSLALKTRPRRERTTGWGVMIDVARPVKVAAPAAAVEISGYHGEPP
jgi:homogentisate 1,2-dioxygenase